MVKNLPAAQETQVRWSGRSSGEENGNPLHCSCLGNPMDRGAWWVTVHGATESRTRLSMQAQTGKHRKALSCLPNRVMWTMGGNQSPKLAAASESTQWRPGNCIRIHTVMPGKNASPCSRHGDGRERLLKNIPHVSPSAPEQGRSLQRDDCLPCSGMWPFAPAENGQLPHPALVDLEKAEEPEIKWPTFTGS